MLSASGNANVQALLQVRQLTLLTRLHPANHPAGAPYDAGLLTIALLIEGGHFEASIAQEIGLLAQQADLGLASSANTLEDFVIATLSLGRQLEYQSLISLAELTKSLEDWSRMATMFRAEPERINPLFTALHYDQAVAPLFTYLSDHPETAKQNIDFALKHGPEAIHYLLELDLPIYQPVAHAAQLNALVAPIRPEFFLEFSYAQRPLTLAIKYLIRGQT
jgi:hypothetical protein